MQNNLVAIPSNVKKISISYKKANNQSDTLLLTGAQVVNFDSFDIKRDMQTHTTLAGDVMIAYETIELIQSINFELWGTPVNYGNLASSFANSIANMAAILVFSYDTTFQNTLFREKFILEGTISQMSPPTPQFKGMYNLKGSFLPMKIRHNVNGIDSYTIDQETRKMTK